MCGIAGILTPAGGEQPTAALAAQIASLRHRGPDDSGTWHDPEGRVHLGHTRLAVLDLSDAGHQPMLSRSERFVVVFNGEIYNFPSLRKELEGRGYDFRSQSDTEVLLGAVEVFGIHDTVSRLIGMFAFFVYDRKEKKGWLARDRFGEKPLFLYQRNGMVAFASEIKALKRCGFFQFALNECAVPEYLAFGFSWSEETLYEGITRVMPGQLVCVDAETGAVSLDDYWNAAENLARVQETSPFSGSFDDAVDKLDELVNKAVEAQRLSDAPLGAFLSGGVDSSLISAVAQAQSERPVSTFSIGFADPRYDESGYARAVARHIGSDHHEWKVSSTDVLDMVPELFHAYDEPFFDSSAIPMLLLSRFARQHVTVALSGDAGDELFLGYNRYARVQRLWRWSRLLPHPAKGLSRSVAAALSRSSVTSPLRRVTDLVSVAGSHSPSELNCILQVLDRSEYHKWCGSQGHGRRHSHAGLSAARIDDIERYLAGDILAKVDRASMRYSLEARVPLLDPDIVDFSMTLPVDYLRSGGEGKRVLRALLRRYVPENTCNPGKKGFSVPLSSWLKRELSGWVDEVLRDGEALGGDLLQVSEAKELVNQLRTGDTSCIHRLWSRLVLLEWFCSNAGPNQRGFR